MSYNKQYNTRHSGRYNTPGHFVAAGEQMPPTPQNTFASPGPQRKPQPQQQNMQQNLQALDVEMKPTPPLPEMKPQVDINNGSEDSGRPYWMKSKLPGVKKVSNKERRRRQNNNLRKLLTPKNALMVLNEMLPNEQLTNQFHVEPSGQIPNQYFNNKQQHSFCADLTIHGNTYKGYGENKLTARNVAAEQAIRDLIIKKMNKVLGTTENTVVSTAGDEGGEEDDDALPMIQLASFALHKLFTEWEYEGHKVPQLKPGSGNSVSESGMEPPSTPTGPPKPKVTKKKEIPANASSMHPCMLLTYMRPHLEYRELSVEGDRPQNMIFTLGVDVDGATYIGKAANKKEARKLAAKAACTALFGVHFSDTAQDNAPARPQ